jgi:hypothetical protein
MAVEYELALRVDEATKPNDLIAVIAEVTDRVQAMGDPHALAVGRLAIRTMVP